MTPTELCEALEAAGCTLAVVGGKVKLRPMPSDAALLAACREQREGLLAEWARRHAGGWGQVPPATLKLREHLLAEACSASGLLRLQPLIQFVVRQPQAVRDWVSLRGARYFEACGCVNAAQAGSCDCTAAADLLCWQWQRAWSPDLLETLGVFANAFKETQTLRKRNHQDTKAPR